MPRRAELPNLHPARLDMTHYRGDSLSAKIRFQHQGNPVDVTHFIFDAYIRDAPNGNLIAMFAIHTEDNGADAVNGIIRIELAYQYAQLLPPSCVWDLQASQVGEDQTQQILRVRTLLRGFIYTDADVTWPELGGADTEPLRVARSGFGG